MNVTEASQASRDHKYQINVKENISESLNMKVDSFKLLLIALQTLSLEVIRAKACLE